MGRIDGPYSVSAARLAGLKHSITQQVLDILSDVKSPEAALRQLTRELVNYETAPEDVDFNVYYVNQARWGFGGRVVLAG